MMKKTNLFLATVLSWLVTACSEPTEQATPMKQYDISFTKPLPAVEVQQISKNYRYIPLETNDNSLLDEFNEDQSVFSRKVIIILTANTV